MRSEETIKSDWHRVERTASAATATAKLADVANAAELSEAKPPERKRILVADGGSETRVGLVNLFESLGYEVIGTRIDETLELARQRLPDAVLLDINAPHLEGLEAARRLRQLAGEKPLLLIALTGWAQPQYRDMAIAAGFDVYLVKPIGLDQLTFLLSMTLG
jgi:CheY-like chemotaxis protein